MEESYKKVSFQEAKHIIDTEPNCVILDVRDEDEYITGHAENAVLFPVDTIDEDTAEEKIPTLDTPILVYCKSGGDETRILRLYAYLRHRQLGRLAVRLGILSPDFHRKVKNG